MEGVSKLLYTFIKKLLSDLIVMNTDLLQAIKCGSGSLDIVLNTVLFNHTMIKEVLDGFQWHRIDGVRAD